MRTNLIAVHFSTAAVLACLCGGIHRGQAASAIPIPVASDSVPASSLQNVAWEEHKVEKLRHAYHLLEHADRDYNGHRDEAMHSIKKAAEILGVELGGKEYAGESQWDSDHRVHEAKHILESLIDETHGAEQGQIRRAIRELSKALATR